MDIVESLKDKVALSVGSACGSSHGATDSYVIKSILKTSPEFISGAVRFGIGRFTTEAEIDYTISAIKETVAKLRKNKNDCDYR